MKQQASIAIEGIDGAGKSTVLNSLLLLLNQRGFDVAAYKYTGRRTDWCGRLIGRLYRSQDLRFPLTTLSRNRALQEVLFAYQARLNLADVQRQNTNRLLLFDRSAITGFAYNGDLFGKNWISEAFVTTVEYSLITKYAIYLDVAPQVALSRIMTRPGGMTHDERIDVLTRVVANYRALFNRSWSPYVLRKTTWFLVDGEQALSQVTQQVMDIVLKILGYRSSDEGG